MDQIMTDILELNKRAALRVARELGYSQMCIEDIKRSTLPYMVDDAMAKERKRIKEKRR